METPRLLVSDFHNPLWYFHGLYWVIFVLMSLIPSFIKIAILLASARKRQWACSGHESRRVMLGKIMDFWCTDCAYC